MAWHSGNILFSSNFEMRVGKPLDAKQIVPTNVDLNSITFPYDGLIVHVTATQETYVCIDKDGVPTGAPLGVIDADVWKVVGGAAADVVVLPDQSPAPSGIADKSQLVSLDDATAESRPDFLYRFNEGVDDATATDDGRLQVNGTKYNTDGDGYGGTSGGAFGDNYAKFSPAKDPRISVGTAGAAAPFYFTSAGGDRGDFEIQFRFSYEEDDHNYALLSTQLTSASTEGFYAVLIDTCLSDVKVEFRSRHLINSVLTTFSAEWKIPSDVTTKQASRHLAISFMEDDRSIAGNTDGSGKLRCYWDGVVCEDDKTAGAYYIAAPEFNNIGRRSSDGTVWALNLGQFLDGSSSGSPAPDTYFLDGKMDEFVVYNHRCLHNTSDKFTRPAVPTRSTALSMPNVVDSEGTASPIITTSNPGMLLPKSVEGVADGSLWNDKGTVKIAPLTGDLDAVALDADVITIPESVAAPSTTAGTAKIYAKEFPVEILLNFNENLTDDGPNSTTITSSNLTYEDGKFGKAADFNGSTVAGSNTHVDFAGAGNDIGEGPYTIECWIYFDSFDAAGRSQLVNSHSDEPAYEVTGFYNIGFYGGSLYVNQHTGSGYIQTIGAHGMSTGTWYHLAVCRDEEGTTRAFRGTSGTNTLIATNTATAGVSIGDAGEDWTLGRLADDVLAPAYNLDGRIDSFAITKAAKYTKVFTVPSAPAPAGITKLYALDGFGNEHQLTP